MMGANDGGRGEREHRGPVPKGAFWTLVVKNSPQIIWPSSDPVADRELFD